MAKSLFVQRTHFILLSLVMLLLMSIVLHHIYLEFVYLLDQQRAGKTEKFCKSRVKKEQMSAYAHAHITGWLNDCERETSGSLLINTRRSSGSFIVGLNIVILTLDADIFDKVVKRS